MKLIFQKNLQFGDIWPWNLKKNAQIEVFGHFLDFASLVFLDFPHNDSWAWCLVVFLQFAGPVNVFLFRFTLLILDLSSEAATIGVLYRKLFLRKISVFTVIAIFNLTDGCHCILKQSYVSILILKAIDSTQKSKRFSSQSNSLQNSAVFSVTPKYHSFVDISFLVKSVFLYH